MIGQTISHYRIVSQLGAGGMGVVYAAQDPRLNRQVALKFVPDELAHDPHTIERLRSEARTASGLNHPNICTIYDIGEHEGRPFIVMELLKGHTLRERMAVRPLKIHEAVDIGIQVADALYWAHSRDVIHRDIKPANLFLVDQGQVKVLDFGLAKFVVPQHGNETTLAPTINLTGVGIALGTVAYMSPEQVSGEVLDRRTDLFSLGVVLYECVTGQQPFQGKTSAVVLASILTQQPTPPMALNASVPHGLQEVIHNCLEKDRELRFQDAAGLRADLKRVKRDLESGAMRVAHTTSVSTVNAAAPPSNGVTSPIPIERPASGSTGTRQPPPASNARMVAGIAAAVIAVAAIAGGIVMSRRAPAPPQNARVVETTPTPAAPPAEPPAAQTPPAPIPQDPAAERARAEARAATARFDAAIVDANRFLAAGDADAATRALNTARAIDPGAPAVADLSARLVEHYKAESARRTTTEPARPQSSQRRPAEPAGRQAQTPAATPQPAPSPSEPPADVTSPPPVSPPAVAPRQPAAEPTVAAPPVAPPPARTEPERRPAPAAAPTPPPAPAQAEDDDTIIRRVVATYGRAIETKDLALYRSVKPNLTGTEQRTIEDGFRAVSSQRVTINIQSIEHRGQEAIVRLRRQDVIQAGGRQQTAESQQSLTLVRSGSGWVIREIGR